MPNRALNTLFNLQFRKQDATIGEVWHDCFEEITLETLLSRTCFNPTSTTEILLFCRNRAKISLRQRKSKPWSDKHLYHAEQSNA